MINSLYRGACLDMADCRSLKKDKFRTDLKIISFFGIYTLPCTDKTILIVLLNEVALLPLPFPILLTYTQPESHYPNNNNKALRQCV